MQQRQQAGWVANFIITAVVLATILFGSLYYLRNYRQGLASTTPQETSSKPSPQAVARPQATNKTPTSSTNNTPSSPISTKQSPPTSNTSKNSDTVANSAGTTNNLPHTGPADTIVSFGILTLIAFSIASYLQSRRV